ncbi:MAG: divalent metal cation transporter [Acidimicrobiia bacterium]
MARTSFFPSRFFSPARARGRLAGLAVLGPGLIAASAGNDAGGIATYASAGSQFAYRMLFLMVPITVALVVVQEMSARLGAHGGEGLVALVRDRCSTRSAHVLVGCLLVANLGLVVSEFAGIGAAFELLGVSRFVAVPVFAVGLWALVVLGSYRWAERAFLLLALVFAAYPVAAVLGHPDWGPRRHADRRSPPVVGACSCSWRWLWSAPRSRPTCRCSRPRRSSTAASARPGTATPGSTPSAWCDHGEPGEHVHHRRDGRDDRRHGTAAQRGRTRRGPWPRRGTGCEIRLFAPIPRAPVLAAMVVPLSTAYAVAEVAWARRDRSRRFAEAPLFLGGVHRACPGSVPWPRWSPPT